MRIFIQGLIYSGQFQAKSAVLTILQTQFSPKNIKIK